MSSSNTASSASMSRALYAAIRSRTALAGPGLTTATYTLRHGHRPPGEARADHPLRARRGRGARAREVEGIGHLPRRAGGHARGELLDRDPAPERDRRPAHGTRPERVDPGHADPDAPHAGPPHEVDLRHRPRRHRHAGE